MKKLKKAVRIINHSNYNAHTEPIFKTRNLLKLKDLYSAQVLKLYYKLVNNRLPFYFHDNIVVSPTLHIHDHNTRRNRPTFFVTHTEHIFARKCLRHEIVRILNATPEEIGEKVHTHSYFGFSQYVKQYYIAKYEMICIIPNCYICNRN